MYVSYNTNLIDRTVTISFLELFIEERVHNELCFQDNVLLLRNNATIVVYSVNALKFTIVELFSLSITCTLLLNEHQHNYLIITNANRVLCVL